jgi:hypothetical protein
MEMALMSLRIRMNRQKSEATNSTQPVMPQVHKGFLKQDMGRETSPEGKGGLISDANAELDIELEKRGELHK